MAIVYIIYSSSIDKFYVGSCNDLVSRLEDHRSHKYSVGFTRRASDWQLFFKIENLEYQKARKIEQHIKNMKSRKYYDNLKKYPEISKALIVKYN